jgi:hypothetical protein
MDRQNITGAKLKSIATHDHGDKMFYIIFTQLLNCVQLIGSVIIV